MCQNGSFSPHHCVGFLFFAWIPPLLFPLLHPTTHHTTTHHSSTSHNSTSHRNSSQLPFMWQAQYTELPGCLSCGRRSTHSFLDKLRRAWPPLARGCLSCHSSHTTHHCTTSHISLITPLITTPLLTSHSSHHACGRRSTQSLLARGCPTHHYTTSHISLITPCVWQVQYTEPPGPRLPFMWQAQYTELPGCLSCGRRSTHQLPGQAAARVAAAGPRLPFVSLITHHSSLHHFSHFTHHTTHHYTHFSHLTHHTTRVAGAVHRASWPAAAPLITTPLLTSHSSHHACGRCSTQSLLARGCLSCGRPSTQSFLAAFRVAGAIHRASWTSCGARGRRWPAAACRVTHHTPLITAPCTYHISLIAPLVWLAQYTEPPGGAASCGRRSTQSPGRCWPAAAFHGTRPPLARGCLSCGRRSTHSFLDKLRRAWPPLARGCLRVTHHTPLTTAPLFTSHSSRSHSSLHQCSHLTHDTTRVAGAV